MKIQSSFVQSELLVDFCVVHSSSQCNRLICGVRAVTVGTKTLVLRCTRCFSLFWSLFGRTFSLDLVCLAFDRARLCVSDLEFLLFDAFADPFWIGFGFCKGLEFMSLAVTCGSAKAGKVRFCKVLIFLSLLNGIGSLLFVCDLSSKPR